MSVDTERWYTMMDRDFLVRVANEAIEMPIYDNPAFPPSPYYRFFRAMATTWRPSLMVELGVCGGGASLHMALGNPEGKVVGIDNRIDYPGNIDFINSTCPNFELVLGDSVESAPSVVEKYGVVDLLFIDTVHTYERTMAEWRAWEPLMAPEAVICMDDLLRPGMNQAWSEVPWKKVRIDSLHPGSLEGGFGVTWRP